MWWMCRPDFVSRLPPGHHEASLRMAWVITRTVPKVITSDSRIRKCVSLPGAWMPTS